ncbi:cysteine protease StiP family protein [Vibrio owensii]|uniref:cysteine protease StiP family protein n=1 Tax=Vibrio owensii TaxID=696485 RepID=UPI0038CDDB29
MIKYVKTSYKQKDCIFLLKEVEMEFTKVEEKERLIQLGLVHYSETVSKELPPTDKYLKLFFKLTHAYKQRLAREVLYLSKIIENKFKNDVCIISLARAGAPIGVLVNRAINEYSGIKSRHYSISIIRDKGIDFNALDHIIFDLGFNPSSIIFLDGWTAKGTITHELKKSISEYNESRNVEVSSDLYVISDIGSTADFFATKDDYTIPSALMNSTVSGLISRSILNENLSNNDFHGCVSYDYLAPFDYSNWFIDEVSYCFSLEDYKISLDKHRETNPSEFRSYIYKIMKEFSVTNINRVKPGIAESTRVMLRRVPDVLIVRDTDDVNVSHLLQLADEKSINVVVKGDMPMGACALIKDVINNEKNSNF